ncbi:hypothetical protein F4680DRAFT_448126 [Xylaria scruposa]|nr:hypothetical protein F4680DRAFT_448126 [Xylaria scruposa]
MSFRAIQPFPLPEPADDGDELPVKNRHVRVCDGTRPRCKLCVSRKKECVFRGTEDQSRESILKSRIKSLEQRVRELQVGQTTRANSVESSTSGPEIHQAHNFSELYMPGILVTKNATDGFFSGSGNLFHVFSQSQVSSIADSVYGDDDNDENECREADIGSLMAVAAVGSQYSNTIVESEVQETFYNVARFYLDTAITQRPLDTIKICSLLCLYNVFGKPTVSSAYVDVGLGICDRYGLHSQKRQLDGITDSMWLDYRNTWHTLCFFSTWLSARVGHKAGRHKVIQQISTPQLEIDHQSNFSKVMKAEILRMHLGSRYLATEPLNLMIQDLQDWYLELPPQMQLQSLWEQNVPLEAKRSVYHVHLLYLGANMLLFRQIVAENVRQHINISPLRYPPSDLLSRQGPNALLAANSSARIVKLLLDENGVLGRCWPIIFQSYTSCIIIMHAILTKLVSSSIPSAYREEMENARLCLEALAYCGATDQVAGRFHDKAEAIYNSVRDYIEEYSEALDDSGREPDDLESTSSRRNTAEKGLPEETPQDIDMQDSGGAFRPVPSSLQIAVEDLSFDLLVMLCRPFQDPSYREESRASTHRSDPTRSEYPSMVERLAWDFEDGFPFHWNPEVSESRMPREGCVQNNPE